MGPTWGPPGSCRPQMGPMLAPRNLLLGKLSRWSDNRLHNGIPIPGKTVFILRQSPGFALYNMVVSRVFIMLPPRNHVADDDDGGVRRGGDDEGLQEKGRSLKRRNKKNFWKVMSSAFCKMKKISNVIQHRTQLLLPSEPHFNIKTVFLGMGIPIMKIRWSCDCLIFIIWIPLLVRWHLYIDMAPDIKSMLQIISP